MCKRRCYKPTEVHLAAHLTLPPSSEDDLDWAAWAAVADDDLPELGSGSSSSSDEHSLASSGEGPSVVQWRRDQGYVHWDSRTKRIQAWLFDQPWLADPCCAPDTYASSSFGRGSSVATSSESGWSEDSSGSSGSSVHGWVDRALSSSSQGSCSASCTGVHPGMGA